MLRTCLQPDNPKGVNQMRRLLTVIAFALLAGCIARTSTVLDSWRNQKADDLVISWGPPGRTTHLSDGRTMLTWERLDNGGICQVSFVADTLNVVRSWTAHGCSAVGFRGR